MRDHVCVGHLPALALFLLALRFRIALRLGLVERVFVVQVSVQLYDLLFLLEFCKFHFVQLRQHRIEC